MIEDERQKLKVDSLPLLKSVCAVHSSALAYKDLCKSVPEITHLVSTLSGLASFFHSSTRTTGELARVARESCLTLRRFPAYFEVRWTEFSSSLIDSILCSWRALMAYLSYFSTVKQSCKSTTADGARYQKSLSCLDNVRLMCFLADLLFLLKKFQKRLQSDDIAITDIRPQLEAFKQKLLNLESTPLIGGWEDVLQKEEKIVDGKTTMFEVELWTKPRRRESVHQYVTDKRDFAAIRHDSIQTLHNFMCSRLTFDDDFDRCVSSMSAFIKFAGTDDDIREVHRTVCPDVELAELADEFKDVQQGMTVSSDESTVSARKMLPILCKQIAKADSLDSETGPLALALALSRILVCKPHSADCERLISAYNRLKTDLRSTIDVETINNYNVCTVQHASTCKI